MKRIATFAAMLVLAACGAKTEEAPKMDSAAAAPAAAPAPEMAAPAMADTTKKDSTAMAAPAMDTAKKM
jgi:uncharacterized lipoprotein